MNSQQADQRAGIIKQILEPEAADRLTRIGVVNPRKKELVENFILMKAQKGELTTKMTDNDLIKAIEEADAAMGGGANAAVKIQRKNAPDSDEEIEIPDC